MKIFQSTLPAGEATSSSRFCSSDLKISIHASRGGSDNLDVSALLQEWISIHASRGGSDLVHGDHRKEGEISIHASRGGSDSQRVNGKDGQNEFQSMLPAREATQGVAKHKDPTFISIHASREGSDEGR